MFVWFDLKNTHYVISWNITIHIIALLFQIKIDNDTEESWKLDLRLINFQPYEK